MRIVAAVGVALGAAFPAHAGDAGQASGVTVAAVCERAAGPGRVRCDVEIRTSAPRVLRWVDVQVVETPPFLSPLKGRIGVADAAVREPELVRIPLGLVARERGSGEVRMRVRFVVCIGEACSPETFDARANVSVGVDAPKIGPRVRAPASSREHAASRSTSHHDAW